MLRSAIISLLVVASATAADAAPKPRSIDGAWAASSQACLDPIDSNIRIVERKYYEHEGSCGIVKETKSGDRWDLSLKCAGEGETWTKSVSISQKSSNELRLLGSGSSFSTLVRCKPQQRPPNWPAQ